MALIDLDIDDHLDEANTQSLLYELKRRKVNFLDCLGQLTDEEMIQVISKQKNLTLAQADIVKQMFVNLNF